MSDLTFQPMKSHSQSLKKGKSALLAFFFAFMSFFAGLGLGAAWTYTDVVDVEVQEQPRYVAADVSDGQVFDKNVKPAHLAKDIDFSLFWDVWEEVKTFHINQPVSETKIFYGAIKGMVAALDDPYSQYFDPDEARQFSEEQLEGKFEGIGAEIDIKNGVLTVVAPLDGSPAQSAGLRPGDSVLMIDGVETFDMSLDFAVSKIRGPKGTQVVLTVVHTGDEEPTEISIMRDVIEVESVRLEWYKTTELEEEDIAYIRLSNFNLLAEKAFRDVAYQVIQRDPKAIILDVRNNPGGFLETSIAIASYWVPKDAVVVRQRSTTEGDEDLVAGGNRLFDGIATIVLVNEGSASASEIVAGALQDYELAQLVGEKTFGKGSVQVFRDDFLDHSALKITVAEWLTPHNSHINDVGIIPDVVIEFSPEDFDDDRDLQLDKALELIRVRFAEA